MMNAIYSYERYFAPAGRILVGVFFLLAGVGKVMGIAGTAAYITSVGLPAGTALAWLAGIFLIATGASLITGFKAKDSACLLAVYTLLVSFLFHAPNTWDADPSQQMAFMKNMAILGGLLVMTAHLKR